MQTNTTWCVSEHTGDHILNLGMMFLRVAVAPRNVNGDGFRNTVLTQAGDWVIFWRNGHVYGHGTDIDSAKRAALDAAKALVVEVQEAVAGVQ